jgi:hypothetical protein
MTCLQVVQLLAKLKIFLSLRSFLTYVRTTKEEELKLERIPAHSSMKGLKEDLKNT